MLRLCSLFTLILLGLVVESSASTRLEGRARLIDGDTIAIGGSVVRLHGIDAPERAQTCPGSGQVWPCGDWAREELGRMIGTDPVVCVVIETDRYGRAVARCRGRHGDLGAEMVLAGAAVAYRRYAMTYVVEEETARRAQRGLWLGDAADLVMPWDWRAAELSPPDSAGPAGCPIKGNISRSGRIYHLPGQQDYDSARIDESRGERWFCSEAEAHAAGWRAARR